jgi:hypothetical protein
MFCHDRKGPEGVKCKNVEECPLKVEHPRGAGFLYKGFGVGCGMCRDLKIKSLEE